MAVGHHTRYVSLATEATYNTPVLDADAVGEVESETMQQTYDILKRVEMNYYGSAKAVTSKLMSSGAITMALQPDAFTLMCLHGIMGVDSGSAATDARVFTEIGVDATDTLPSFTVMCGRDESEHVFAGQVVDSISVSSSIGEYAMLTVNFTGAKQNDDNGALHTTLPAYTGDAAHFSKAYVNFEAGVNTSDFSPHVQSIDFEIRTNRDMDNTYSLSSDTCVRKPPVTTREITGSITFHKSLVASIASDVANNEPNINDLMPATNALKNGSVAAPALSALFYVDADNYIQFEFPKVIYEMPETSVSGRDSQTMTVNFHALYDLADANSMMQIRCKTSDTTVADYDAL